jgi:hypothetical protein
MRTLDTLKRFRPTRAQLIGGSLILSAGMLALAAVPNTFTSGTTISSAAVNDNFSALDTRTGTLEGVNAASRLGALETTVTGGNIVLVPSTATAGNIMKGTARFLHNYGTGNTFLGENAGNFTMTGGSNTASGYQTLFSNTTGYNNTASGVTTLYYNTTGYGNTANGASALESNTTGHSNTASGLSALFSNTAGFYNTASGLFALYSNTSGNSNTANGLAALRNNTTGNGNTAIGYQAGFNLTTGSNNIAIDNLGVADEANTTRIGDSQTRTFIAGIRGVTTANANAIAVVIDSAGQLGTVSSSRHVKDNIADMGEASSTLMKLRPVTFHYKSDRNPKGRSLQYGLIAEEVEKVAPNLVARSADGEIETVFYQHLTPMLLNEYQKQQRTIEAQSAMLARQTMRIAALEKQAAEVAELRQQMARVTATLSRMQQPDRIAAVGRQ